MKKFKYNSIFFSLILLTACSGADDQSEQIEGDLQTVVNEGLDKLEEEKPDWQYVQDGDKYEIEIPSRMEFMERLHPEAVIKYAEVRKDTDRVYENYIMILPETHEEIASYELGFEFTTQSYHQHHLKSMGSDMVEYTILTPESKVEDINGLEGVISEMQGTLVLKDSNLVDIYYMMGVIQGEKAFYQVLSWTVADQQGLYKRDMERMIRSFREIKQ
ncbi:MAG: hypothetical protein ABJG68_06245 [Crocinitomicaceae bacterium]